MKNVRVNFDTWIQLLGMIGVLGGLMFVGLEMRQAQTIAVAGQAQARNQAQLDFQLGVLTAENGFSRDVFGMGSINRLNPTDLTKEEAHALRHILNWRAISLQNAFQQYKMGLLPEDVWEQAKSRTLLHWESCYSRPTLAGVIPSFREYLESLAVEDCAE
jgi:hypothetical protein